MPNYSDFIVEESYDLLDLAYACEEYGYPNDASNMINEIATEAVGDNRWFLNVADRVADAQTPEKKEAILSAAASAYFDMAKHWTTKDGSSTDSAATHLRAKAMHDEITDRLARVIPSTPEGKDKFLHDDAKGILRRYNAAIKEMDTASRDKAKAMHSMQKHKDKLRDKELRRDTAVTKAELRSTKDELKDEKNAHQKTRNIRDDAIGHYETLKEKYITQIDENYAKQRQIDKDDKFKRNTKIGVIALAIAAAAVGGAMLLKKHKAKAAARKAELSRSKYFEEHNISDDKKDSYLYNLRKTIISDASKIINKLKSDKNIKTSGVNIVGRSSGIENGASIQVIEKGSNTETVQSVMKALKDKYVDECEAGILSIGYTDDKIGIKIIVK